MAGGRGERLMPLTENTPKPLLKVGSKAIIQYNVDLLNLYGIKKIVITINYLGFEMGMILYFSKNFAHYLPFVYFINSR